MHNDDFAAAYEAKISFSTVERAKTWSVQIIFLSSLSLVRSMAVDFFQCHFQRLNLITECTSNLEQRLLSVFFISKDTNI